MIKKKAKKTRYLKIHLTTAVFVLTTILISGFFIFGPELTEVARALTGDYAKTSSGGGNPSLTHVDWNNLPSEFLDKSGDTMSGSLNMGNNVVSNLADPTADDQAVNRGYMNSQIASQIPILTNTSGVPLKVVCGKSTPADWVTYGTTNDTVYVDVDMVAAGFTSNPNIVTSIYGSQQHWKTYGATSIYDLTSTSFRVYIYSIGLPVNATIAQNWGWGINWCGYGN